MNCSRERVGLWEIFPAMTGCTVESSVIGYSFHLKLGFDCKTFEVECLVLIRTILGFTILFVIRTSDAHDCPTIEIIDYALTCMERESDRQLDNFYACSCEIDAIAMSMPYDDFVSAKTFETFGGMPGEKGGIFRDNEDGKILVNRFQHIRKQAQNSCFLKNNRRN